ncbi:MAG: hypothetical protein HYY18_17770 [Planctomycetes bacterium]|nr:hypothetical protein [Planctomycetota bacterium]
MNRPLRWTRSAGIFAILAAAGTLAQGCAARRILGIREGHFSHGEGGVIVERLPSRTPATSLRWDASKLDQGTLVLSYVAGCDCVVEYETAWFHKIEVVQDLEDEPVDFYMIAATICTITVILFPVAVLLVLEAISPEFSPPWGHVLRGEYVMRKKVRVRVQEYSFLWPPAGATIEVAARGVDPWTELSRQTVPVNHDGRFAIEIGPEIERAAADGSGLLFVAALSGANESGVAAPELFLPASRVREIHDRIK